ncbi:MAG: hypothetical protein R3B70_46835 [Polyangiaceae bacterium]
MAQAREVTDEFERLLANKRIVIRPKSKQWMFLRHCFSVLLAGKSSDAAYTKQQALQYRFEVEDRLRRYYLSPGRPVSFVFRFMHIDKALSLGLVDDAYPNANGYVLLVAEEGLEIDDGVGDVLERVVADATDAEWAVYQALPDLLLLPLETCFVVDGPAYKRIRHLAERHHDRRWTLKRPESNPSTKRVLDVKVVKIEGDRGLVRTKEYWYLRWWSLDKNDYAKVDYRETNMQTYVMVRRDGRWMVEENIYPPPRSSTPHRKSVVVG